MRFIITGANGFIGSYLSRYLVQKGHQVTAVSRKFYEGVRKQLHGATLIESDVLSPHFPELKMEGDVFIHLASANDILSKDLTKGIELSTVGTVNTFKSASANRIQNYIFFSTLQVYGTELSGDYSEQTPGKPENDYGINHLFGEMYAEMFSRKTDIKVLVVRPSNIYGPFLSPEIQRWTLVPGSFCKEAVEKGTVTLLSSGKQFRNFISLETCSALIERVTPHLTERFDILNLVSNDYRRIIDLAEIVADVMREDFGQEVEVIVRSDQPIRGNDFRFSFEALKRYGIDSFSSGEKEIRTAIRSVCKMLLETYRP